MTARTPSDQEPSHVRLILGIRQQHHWTQAQLGQHLGLTGRTIREWESGRSDPRVGWMLALHALLQADISP